ncbi:MAG TPA: hypothetical protein DGR97_02805 [Gammaproteobacteria bacterium]|nr:hypothetical protein [Gammaproteobacteria bacterium]|tara:strand:- start:1619 stop:2443 length:825 start_codon:yes stop_codon:yes gene_type:complete
MRAFTIRRCRNLLLTAIGCLFAYEAVNAAKIAFFKHQFFSGWLLLSIVAFLALYNLRKRFVTIPLGSNATWLQLHIYVGLTSVFVFFLHLDWEFPKGYLEVSLACLFILVASSGALGIYLSRRLPKFLTRRGEEVIFERIPYYIGELKREAETLVLEAAELAESTTLPDHYRIHLGFFFSKPRHFFSHLLLSRRPLYGILTKLESIERYLNPDELEASRKLRLIVEKKDELDFHFALQYALKAWLFIHIPTTFVMLLLTVLHLVVAYSFSKPLG